MELLTGQWAFDPKAGRTWSMEDDHLASMLALTGETFSTSMLAHSKLRDNFLNEEGKFSPPACQFTSLTSLLHGSQAQEHCHHKCYWHPSGHRQQGPSVAPGLPSHSRVCCGLSAFGPFGTTVGERTLGTYLVGRCRLVP